MATAVVERQIGLDGMPGAADAADLAAAADGLAATPLAVMKRRDQNRGNSYFRR
jgi:hypothetical protein